MLPNCSVTLLLIWERHLLFHGGEMCPIRPQLPKDNESSKWDKVTETGRKGHIKDKTIKRSSQCLLFQLYSGVKELDFSHRGCCQGWYCLCDSGKGKHLSVPGKSDFLFGLMVIFHLLQLPRIFQDI